MRAIGASKIALSTLSSQNLWRQSGRLEGDGNTSPEIFKVQDRKDTGYILSPTHEEEVTRLVGNIINSYKELPLRLYQITRKYRDEARPRQGLLRTREFLMKDLYTFDSNLEDALYTYRMVENAYRAFFNEFKLPYLVAKASSGTMGGDLSHEYHFVSGKGEDNLITCASCDFVVNEEIFVPQYSTHKSLGNGRGDQRTQQLLEFVSELRPSNQFYQQWFAFSAKENVLVQAILPTKAGLEAVGVYLSEEPQANTQKVQELLPELDMSAATGISLETAKEMVEACAKPVRVYRVYDRTIRPLSELLPELVSSTQNLSNDDKVPHSVIRQMKQPVNIGLNTLLSLEVQQSNGSLPRLTRVSPGEKCTHCGEGHFRVQTAVEVGHTFHLGTRYSQVLDATIAGNPGQISDKSGGAHDDHSAHRIPMQMGCHGIGVSRLVAAVADVRSDSKGLSWPRVMAPFDSIVIPSPKISTEDQSKVYDILSGIPGSLEIHIDTVLDDRQKDMSWKLKDADMTGYPVLVVMGRGWINDGNICEVQCRRLGVKKDVHLEELRDYVSKLLEQL